MQGSNSACNYNRCNDEEGNWIQVDAMSNVDHVMFEKTSKVSFQSIWPLLIGGLVLLEGLFVELDN